ncbi:polysaccharide deacetylase family protein [Clostridium sp. UBA5988]|uniref:polysaccharide deacetylase family protein n=1 Tax=Clostridium sp. UBA5988 TaxID=1946369 RepID=UPI003217DA9D
MKVKFKTFIKKNIYKLIPIIGAPLSSKLSFPIIYYHDIVEDQGYSLQKTNFTVFKEQMIYLSENNYNTLLFSEVGNFTDKKLANKKNVMITFDDGYRSNYELAFPLMKELGLKFNIFICPKMIENKHPEYLSKDMLDEMYKSGLVEFGSHTYSHVDASLSTEEELLGEIQNCNKKISEWLGYSTKDFCYPYGKYTKKTSPLLSNYYERIYTSDCKPLTTIGKAKERGRIGISTDDSLKDFRNKLNGRYNILFYYYRLKAKFN